jgi:hypothetical protein
MLWLALLLLLAMLMALFVVLRQRARRQAPQAAPFAAGPRAEPRKMPVAEPRKMPVAEPSKVSATAPSKASTPPAQHWGKRLVVAADACPVARQQADRHFPIGKLPTLPLKGCDHANCTCHLVPLGERRSNNERRHGEERREMARFEAPEDRRSGQQRRHDDHYIWHTTI